MKIPKSILVNLASLAVKKHGMYNLNGVHFYKRGKTLSAEATNGAVLVRVEWPDETKRKKDLETFFSTESIKAVPAGGGPLVDLRELEKVSGIYPLTADIICDHDTRPCTVVRFDPVLLAKLLKAVTSVVPLAKPPCVECIFPLDPKRAVQMSVVAKDRSVSVVGVIMPMMDKGEQDS